MIYVKNHPKKWKNLKEKLDTVLNNKEWKICETTLK